MNFDDITFVFQGGVTTASRPALVDAISKLRALAPEAQIILSTTDAQASAGLDCDRIVIVEDAGPLPSTKRAGLPNNINRQITSSRAGLAAVTTRYAAKIRSDCALEHLDFLKIYDEASAQAGVPLIAVCSLFTIDPLVFEQMPYHLSDWFQFGPSDEMLQYWSSPLMTLDEATYYMEQPYAKHSNFFDRHFIAQLAVEQQMAVHYAKGLGYLTPRFHNDMSNNVIRDFNRFMAERTVVLDPAQIGLVFPKYEWAFTSEFQNLNCMSHLDWQMTRDRVLGVQDTDANHAVREQRRAKKAWTRKLFRMAEPLGPVLYNRGLRKAVNRTLKWLAN